MPKNRNIKNIVEELMRDDPRCRRDDTWLMIQVFRKLGAHFYIDYSDLKNLPAIETITKARRKIQNEENKYNEEEFIPEPGVSFEMPPSPFIIKERLKSDKQRL